jgi:hypothetical protein
MGTIAGNCHKPALMKTPLPAVLNQVKAASSLESALYAARLLNVATSPSPAVTVRAAIAAMPTKPTNPAVAANALFPGSPAFATGAGRPAYPAVSAPAIVPIPGWFGASVPSETEYVVYVPLAQSPGLLGVVGNSYVSELSRVMEFTPSALTVPGYFGEAGLGTTAEVTDATTPTLEKYFYKKALAVISEGVAGASIVDAVWTIGTTNYPCKRVTLPLTLGPVVVS